MDRTSQMDAKKTDRRQFIKRSIQLLGLSTALASMAPKRAFPDENKKRFIEKAYEMQRIAIDSGDQAYGAVVVKEGKIVGSAPSRVVVNHDPTAHGEMEAIRDASQNLKTNDLSGCELYSNAQPCCMCEAAAYWANISRMYYGSRGTDGGEPRYSSC